MSDSLMGELLCLFLLILISGRIFFSVHKNSITIAVLAPVVLMVSIFQILAQGITFFEVLIFLLSFLTFIFNIHAFSRFISHLYVDRYRVGFYLFSLFILICSISLTAVVIYFREVPVKGESFGVVEKKEQINGIKGVLWTFEENPSNAFAQEKNPVIIFSGDKRSDVHRYRPYLIALAKKGYKIYAFDSFVPYYSTINPLVDNFVFRRTFLQYLSLYKPGKFAEYERSYSTNIMQEYKVLREIALERHGSDTPVFLIGDSMQQGALENLALMQNSIGSMNLCEIDLYKTKGFGCVCQTAPFLAWLLEVESDNSLVVPEGMAVNTKNAVEQAQKSMQNKTGADGK